MFKKGDIVECIDNGGGFEGRLDLGRRYTVRAADVRRATVYIEGDEGGWFASRFRLVQTSITVGLGSAGAAGFSPPPPPRFKSGDMVLCIEENGRNLKLGRIYVVTRYTPVGGNKGVPETDFVTLKEATSEPINEEFFARRFIRAPATPTAEDVRRLLDQPGRQWFRPPQPEEGPPAHPAKPNPIFAALGKRWSHHPSDAALQLNELEPKSD